MFQMVEKKEISLYKLAGRFGRQIRKRVDFDQFINIAYNVHVDDDLKEIMRKSMKKAWKRTFKKSFKSAENNKMVEKSIQIFREQTQAHFERVYMTKTIAIA